MSRIKYIETPATADQETLRKVHRVRLVTAPEEGAAVNALPGGVYGFTYSPALVTGPLFATRRYRTYETHKLPNGEILLIGFVTAEEARRLSIATTDVQVRVQPEPEAGVESLVCISYSRIRQHRQFSVRNEHGLTITVAPTALQG